MSKILKLQNGKEIDLDVLYPKEERKPVSINDWEDDECQELTEEECQKYFCR